MDDDLDDDIDMDDFDIPNMNKKIDDIMNTAPDLSMCRDVSFGPIKQSYQKPIKKQAWKQLNDCEEEKINSSGLNFMGKKPTSIASFLQTSLNNASGPNLIGFAPQQPPSLFTASSKDNDKKSKNALNPMKRVVEPERWMEDLEMMEDGDLDDIDFDTLEEPSFR